MGSAPVLVVMTGLPATGKSAIAEAVARALPAPVFSVDPLEATLNRAGITRDQRSGYAAYDLAATLAESQLRLGQSAVIDAVNATIAIRSSWRELGARHDVPVVVLATTCCDAALHRARLEGRKRDIEGFLYDANWAEVEQARAHHEPAGDADLQLEAASSLADNITSALRLIDARSTSD